MHVFAAGELADVLDGLLAALGDDVGGAELARERDAVLVAAHDDDLLGPEALGGDHTAQADGAVAHHGHPLAGADPGDHRRVVARPYHVREGQQGRHQRVVLADRQRIQRAVGQRYAHRLGLRPVIARVAEEADVHARGRQTLAAERAGAVGVRERHDDEVALLDLRDLRSDVLDHADGLMAHASAGLAARHLVVRMEVAAADAARVTRTTASVGSTIAASGTSWTRCPAPVRARPARHNESAQSARRRRAAKGALGNGTHRRPPASPARRAQSRRFQLDSGWP